MRGQQDHHVQAWVRSRVRVLRLLEELHALTCPPCKREMRRAEWSVIHKACGR